jgi:hypothetical protein
MGVVNAYEAAQAISPYRVEGTVSDASTSLPINRAEIRVIETGQRIDTDISGHYEVGALLQEVRVLVEKFGYYPDTSEVFSLGGPTLVHDVELVPLARGRIEGTMTDTSSGIGIRAGIVLYSNGVPVDTVFTELETGDFSFEDVPVSSPPLNVYTNVEGRFLMPYPYSVIYPDTIIVEEGETTILDLTASPARVLLADDDDGLRHEKFYTSSVDTAGWTYYHHDVYETGESVIFILDEFPQGTILIWYTGMQEETLSEEEQDSLSTFLDRGGKLLLSSQNVAEDLSSSGSPFLTERLHAGYLGNTTLEDVEGYQGDPVFDGFLMRTKGLGGAYNQYSRDILIPDGVSTAACYYTDGGGGPDSLVAGILIDDPDGNGSRIIFLGFGFEAVTMPSPPGTAFATRNEVMAEILDWLEGPVGIGGGDREKSPGTLPKSYALSQNFPNPFNPMTTISFDIPDDGSKFHLVRLIIFDVRGRVVRDLLDRGVPAGRHRVVWNGKNDSGRSVSSGIYMYRLTVDDQSFTRKMLLLK